MAIGVGMSSGKRKERTMQTMIVMGLVAAVAVATPSYAVIPVVDVRAIVQMVQQLQQLQQHLVMLQKQYGQLVNTYNAIAHLPQTATAQFQTQLDQFRNPLPPAGSSGSLLNGTLLSPLSQSFLDRNHVYSSSSTDFAATEMGRKAKGIAGALALANQLFAASSGRINALKLLEGQLASAPDEKATLDISARIQAEHAFIQSAQVQAQSLAVLAAAEQRNDQQRQAELRRQSVDAAIADAVAHGG